MPPPPDLPPSIRVFYTPPLESLFFRKPIPSATRAALRKTIGPDFTPLVGLEGSSGNAESYAITADEQEPSPGIQGDKRSD